MLCVTLASGYARHAGKAASASATEELVDAPATPKRSPPALPVPPQVAACCASGCGGCCIVFCCVLGLLLLIQVILGGAEMASSLAIVKGHCYPT